MNSRRRVIIDADILTAFENNTNFRQIAVDIIEHLKVDLVIHPYIAKNEIFGLKNCNVLIEEGIILVVEEKEFIHSEFEKTYYLEQFREHFYYMNNVVLEIPQGMDIMDFRKSKSNLGEIHSCLMALYLEIPLFISNDRDVKNLARDKINNSKFELRIINLEELMIDLLWKEKDQILRHNEVRDIIHGRMNKETIKRVERKWGVK